MKRIPIVFILMSTAMLLSAQGTASDEIAGPPEPAAAWSVPGFSTDFSRMEIDPARVFSGGPPKDGIPAVDAPEYETIAEAAEWLADSEPVILLSLRGESRIYPVSILTWHEIANDRLSGTPVAVTYCPLCNTGAVFHREHRGRTLDFGTTGRLAESNLLMYDRQTESWWQQATGRAVIGEFTGDELIVLPSLNLSFADAVRAAPTADVLSRETGAGRPYGRNPYERYDSPGRRPFLYQGELAENVDPMQRVLVVKHKGAETVVSYTELQSRNPVMLEMAGDPVVVFLSPGTVSALDTPRIADGRKVGSLNAFIPRIDGRELTFRSRGGGGYTDGETGSVWTGSGRAVSGPLEGQALIPVVGIQHFSFSAAAFTVVPVE